MFDEDDGFDATKRDAAALQPQRYAGDRRLQPPAAGSGSIRNRSRILKQPLSGPRSCSAAP